MKISIVVVNPDFKKNKNRPHLQGTFEYCKAYEFVKTEEDFERRRTNIALLAAQKKD